MHRRTSTLLASVVALIGGCTPQVSPLPAPDPTHLPNPISQPPGVSAYRFSPDTYRYRFQQTADIRGDGPGDSIPSTITTRGVFVVHVTAEPDSTISILVSADSISIASQGSIPSRSRQQIPALDTVITARFSQNGTITSTQLSDSLCTYSHLIMAARELLLPELGLELKIPANHVHKDTVTQHACRAGVIVELETTREIRDLSRNPAQLALEQRTQIHGAGMLRRDSIVVTGSVTTRGVVQFATTNRLPSSSQTRSDGIITVRLGNTTTTFHQTSTQELTLKPADLP